jgi:hypothetical protein
MAANNSMTQEQMEQFAQSLARLASQVDTTRQGFGPFADAQREAADELKNGMKTAAQQLGNSVVSLFKTIDPLQVQQGLGKFSGAVEGAADGIGSFAQTLGPLGFVVGTVVKLFGQLAGASLKQNDMMMKAYRDLAETGSVSGSLEKLNSDLHRVGLTSGEAEKFGQMVGKVTPDLAAFGGSVTGGKDRLVNVFEGMIGVGSKTELQLNRLGYSTDTMREATADYIARQSRLGLTQGKTTEQLRGESVSYMKTLRELQEVTGLSRDEAQKILDQQQTDARFAMVLREIEATQGHAAAERARMGMAAFSKTFGSEAAADLIEQVANKGAIVGEASARSQASTLGQGQKLFQAVVDNQIDAGQMIIGVSQAVSRNMEALGPAARVAGDGMNAMTGSAALQVGAYANANKKYEDVNKTLGDKTKIAGDRLQENVEIEQKQRVMRIAADKAIYEIGNITVGVFQKLNDIMYKFAKTIAKMVDWINATIFRTKTNYADMFKDSDDFKADAVEANKAKADMQKELSELKATPQFNSGKEYTDAINNMTAELSKKDIEMARIRSSGASATPEGQEKLKQLAEEREALRLRTNQLEEEKDKVVLRGGVINKEKQNAIRQERLQTIQEKIAKEDQRLQEIDKKLKNFEAQGSTGNATLEEARQRTSGASKGTAFTTDAKGVQVSQDKLEQRQGAQANLAARAASVDSSEILNKLNFGGQKGERTGGGEADPRLLALAELVQKEFPGATFTALNDAFHKNNRPNSKHTVGKALDFVPGKDQIPKNADEAALIKERLKDLGANIVRDEFFAEKEGGTGGHFHLEVAREGGLFKGPNSGYPVMLHGKNESAWPEQKLQGLLQDVEKSSVEKYKQELMDKMGLSEYNKPNQTSALASGDSSQLEDLVSRMINKFDTLISLQDKSNNITDELLTYTRA